MDVCILLSIFTWCEHFTSMELFQQCQTGKTRGVRLIITVSSPKCYMGNCHSEMELIFRNIARCSYSYVFQSIYRQHELWCYLQYFLYKLRNTTTDEYPIGNNTTHPAGPIPETDLQVMFESYLTIAAMIPNVLFMYLNTLATHW